MSARFSSGNTKILDAFLSALEVYVNQDRENSPVVSRLVAVITQMLHSSLTEENIGRLMGYANLYYIRRLPNYWAQLQHILRIVLDLYMTCILPYGKSWDRQRQALEGDAGLNKGKTRLQGDLDTSGRPQTLSISSWLRK